MLHAGTPVCFMINTAPEFDKQERSSGDSFLLQISAEQIWRVRLSEIERGNLICATHHIWGWQMSKQEKSVSYVTQVYAAQAFTVDILSLSLSL